MLILTLLFIVQCHSNNDCPDDESCESGSCIKVCSRVRCGTEAHCVARGHTASCECDNGARGNPWIGCRRAECTVDEECPSWLACRSGICQNPCPGACAPEAQCSVVRHIPVCECPRGTEGNPQINCHPGIVLYSLLLFQLQMYKWVVTRRYVFQFVTKSNAKLMLNVVLDLHVFKTTVETHAIQHRVANGRCAESQIHCHSAQWCANVRNH